MDAGREFFITEIGENAVPYAQSSADQAARTPEGTTNFFRIIKQQVGDWWRLGISGHVGCPQDGGEVMGQGKKLDFGSW